MRLSFIKNGALATAAVLLVTLSGPAMAKSGNAIRTGDMHFAREAALGGMFEVDLGKIVVEKAASDKVKQFGQRMVDDHTKVNANLREVAARDNITLPSHLDPHDNAIIYRFSNMSGTAFDRAYIRDMVKDHEADIAAFEKEANSGMNPDLKSFAATTLPTLREHLRLAEDTDTSLGVTSRK